MFLDQQRPTQALHAFMNELRADASDVRIDLEPPRTVIEVEADDPVFGPSSAAVEIIEFSDFQCPFCQRLTDTLEQLKSEHGSDIRLVFKDYPLPNHAQAFKAAEAGNCANQQGKFWELHDTMFSRQSELGVDDLKRHAGELGMDQAAFDACLDSGRFAEQVNAGPDGGSAVWRVLDTDGVHQWPRGDGRRAVREVRRDHPRRTGPRRSDESAALGSPMPRTARTGFWR